MATSVRTRRWGHGTASVARHLLGHTRPVTQVELATECRLSQPAVSKVLNLLAAQAAATQVNSGWVAERSVLLDSYAEGYVSRLAVQGTLWYRIDTVREQAADIAANCESAVISGDAGADLVRPWRFPTVAVTYADMDATQMTDLGFVPADDQSAATAIVRPVPDRRLIDESERIERMLVAPRLHLAADLVVLSSDRREHGERIIHA